MCSSLPSEKSHLPSSERSKLFLLFEASYLFTTVASGHFLEVNCVLQIKPGVGVCLPFFIFSNNS